MGQKTMVPAGRAEGAAGGTRNLPLFQEGVCPKSVEKWVAGAAYGCYKGLGGTQPLPTRARTVTGVVCINEHG